MRSLRRSPDKPAKTPKQPKWLGLTQVEFARRDGCTCSLVSNAIRRGELTTLSDGSLDPALVGSGWRATNRRKIEATERLKREQQPREPASGEFISGNPDDVSGPLGALLMDRGEGERAKITLEVWKRKREHDLEIGKVILIETARKKIVKDYAAVRQKLLAIPNGHAAQISALKTPAEVQDYLLQEITRALEDLSDAI